MSKYTIHDLKGIIPAEQTATTREAIEKYINEGVIPPYDPCLSCEPNHIRKLISVIQVAERNGLFPPKRESPEEARVIHVNDNPTDPDVDFTEIFSQDVDWSEETLVEAEDQDE